MNDYKIMIVDDDEIILDNINDFFNNYNLSKFSNPKKALKELNNNFYDIIIADYRMPDINGLELLIEAKKNNSYEYGILLTAFAEKDILEKFINNNLINKVIEKPLRLKELKNILDEALKYIKNKKEKEQELNEIKIKYENALNGVYFLNNKIIGFDGSLKNIFSKINSIAKSDENILITGETGTGKEVIARTIYSLSNRKDNAFIKINCGAIPETLIESELFGYKKGAFTGAISEKIGKIELANNGILFLDEITELKPDMQTSLLQVIQEKKITRLGHNKEININFRLIAATHQNIERLVKDDIFREDLYYRINILNIHLPPLRERKEDLKSLIDYLLDKYIKEVGRKPIILTEKAYKLLMDYKWQGNIRELENVLKRAIILLDHKETEINEKTFNYLFHDKNSFNDEIGIISNKIIEEKMPLKKIEEKIISYILDKFNGDIIQASKNSAISKDKFYRYRKKQQN